MSINCKQLSIALPALVAALLFSSCAKTDTVAPEEGPQATVVLRDGSKLMGRVVSSSLTEVKLAGDDNVTRTLSMKDVKSIRYGDEPVAATNRSPSNAARKAAPRRDPEPFHEIHERPDESVIRTKTFELPAGTEIAVRTEEMIDSSKAVEGQTFAADVTRDVLDADGAVVLPGGSNAQIVILSSAEGGRVTGKSDLVLDLQSVSVGGRRYVLQTADLVRSGKDGLGKNKRTATYTGGGAAVGALIGAIAGQGKGAAIGAATGAAAGAAAQVMTKGGEIRIPPETVLTFRLDQPLRVATAQAARVRSPGLLTR